MRLSNQLAFLRNESAWERITCVCFLPFLAPRPVPSLGLLELNLLIKHSHAGFAECSLSWVETLTLSCRGSVLRGIELSLDLMNKSPVISKRGLPQVKEEVNSVCRPGTSSFYG